MRELTISSRSKAALEAYADERFVDRLVFLVSDMAAPEEGPSEVRRRCRDLVARARARGFTTEFEVAVYTACGFAEGDDFDLRADLSYRSILENLHATARAKAEMLALVLERSESVGSPEGEA